MYLFVCIEIITINEEKKTSPLVFIIILKRKKELNLKYKHSFEKIFQLVYVCFISSLKQQQNMLHFIQWCGVCYIKLFDPFNTKNKKK